MPFIWDDEEWMLIDDDEFEPNSEEYDGFVIAHRLYVSSKTPIASQEILYKRFKKYGAIKSIEIRKSQVEAYITFESDHTACFAYTVENNDDTQIAFTWRKPSVESSAGNKDRPAVNLYANDELPPILDLNVDCLFAIFDRCSIESLVNLSQTCFRFANLLEKDYRFQCINKTFDFCMHENDDRISMTLAEARQTLRLMGPYFEHLELYVPNYRLEGYENFDNIVYHYFQQIVKYAKNTVYLCLWIGELRNDFISLFNPIFRNLNKLGIITYTDDMDVVDFTELCPKLKKLEITKEKLIKDCLKRQWISLESFDYSDSELNDNFWSFLSLNSHLKRLKLTDESLEIEQDGLLEDIFHRLPNIEYLTLNLFGCSSVNSLVHLGNLKNLTNLTLRRIRREHFTDVVAHLTRLKNLQQIKLLVDLTSRDHNGHLQANSIIDERQSVVNLVQTLHNLKRVDLVGLDLTEANTIDIIRFGMKLNLLHVHHCKVLATESLVTAIVNERKSYRQPQEQFKLFVDRNEQNHLNAINNIETKRYLSVRWDCHEYLN